MTFLTITPAEIERRVAAGLDPRASFSAYSPRLQIAWDSVSMGALKKCARLYQLQIVEGWSGKHESHHLRYGQLYHHGIEVYNHKICDGEDHEQALISALKSVAEGSMNTDAQGVRSWWDPAEHLNEEKAKRNTKTIPNLFRTLIWYLDKYGIHDPAKTVVLANGRPAVELSFRYELGYTFVHENGEDEELLHSGHMDRLVEYHKDYYVMDFKTSQNTITGNSSWGFFAKYSPDNQMSGYTYASRVVLAVTAKGVIIDAAQIAKGFSAFERGFSMRTERQLDEWRIDFIHWVKLAEGYAKANYWPMNDTACDHYGGCTFRNICNKDPAVREVYLKADFTKRPWDPLSVRGDI